MSSESERTERLIHIVRTAGLLSANVPPIIDRLRGPGHWQADRSDGPALRLRLKHWHREIQRLWSMIPLELPELAADLMHIRKPGPWSADDPAIDWNAAAAEWRMVEDRARRLLAGCAPSAHEARRWCPPDGYVGVKEIGSDPRFRKHGKNPALTTIDVWIQRAQREGNPLSVVPAPDTRERYVPEEWVHEQIRRWTPRPVSATT